MRVDARDVKIHSSAEHVDFAVGQKVGQVLLHDMGGTVIAAGEATQQLAAAVVRRIFFFLGSKDFNVD